MNSLLQLGSLGPCELDPTSQIWESTDFGIFDPFEPFGPPSTASQEIVKPRGTETQETAVSGSKVVGSTSIPGLAAELLRGWWPLLTSNVPVASKSPESGLSAGVP